MDAILLGKMSEIAAQQTNAALATQRAADTMERLVDELKRAEEEREAQHDATRKHMTEVGNKIVVSASADMQRRDEFWRKAAALGFILGIAKVIADFWHH